MVYHKINYISLHIWPNFMKFRTLIVYCMYNRGQVPDTFLGKSNFPKRFSHLLYIKWPPVTFKLGHISPFCDMRFEIWPKIQWIERGWWRVTKSQSTYFSAVDNATNLKFGVQVKPASPMKNGLINIFQLSRFWPIFGRFRPKNGNF